MIVKKEDTSAYFKGKNFYISLLVGVCAVIVIVAVYVSVTNNRKEDLVDLNEPLTNVAEVEQGKSSTDKTSLEDAKQEQRDMAKMDNQSKANEKDSLLENDIVVSENASTGEEKAKAKEVPKNTEVATQEKKVQEETVPVMNPSTGVKLNFQEDKGILWPIKGNPDVILKYSMDKVVYYETLMQYKCNPAILIGSKAGTEVISGAKGIITEITTNEETGLTLTMSIGKDYSLVYGQLKDLTVDVGDVVEEGDKIGVVAEPTKYYLVEGDNLYFKVLEKEETVDPMLLLR